MRRAHAAVWRRDSCRKEDNVELFRNGRELRKSPSTSPSPTQDEAEKDPKDVGKQDN